MKTIKEFIKEMEYIKIVDLRKYLKKKDVNKIIDEAFIDSGARKIDFKEELKARING